MEQNFTGFTECILDNQTNGMLYCLLDLDKYSYTILCLLFFVLLLFVLLLILLVYIIVGCIAKTNKRDKIILYIKMNSFIYLFLAITLPLLEMGM